MKAQAEVISNSSTTEVRGLHVVVEGIVQGVGFRPCVHRLARKWAVNGTVGNFTGGVEIELEGPQAALEGFVNDLRSEPPPMAVIESITTQAKKPTGKRGFVIIPSHSRAEGLIYVSPDIALCADCRRELLDPADRRFRHPFINCTNCGPRYTIIARLPYDRPATSMTAFPMCPACKAEYHDIEDRRYHAQPVCCPDCGPKLSLVTPESSCAGEEALRAAQEMLARGKIVAVKGLGGLHLACDATNGGAVRRLRERKHREQKPLAVMAPTVEAIDRFAGVSEEARELLQSARAPIVLLPKRQPEQLAASIAPDSPDYGVMLPYTPLHVLLFEGTKLAALVMTSGNLSDEPLCTDNQETIRRLTGIADGSLMHDREILVGCDDSVLRATRRGPILLRRSRGFAPLPVRLRQELPPVLGVGGHLKNTFCLTRGREAFLSQHIGDLADAPTHRYFQECLAHLLEVWQAQPEAVACDMHPDYLSSQLARDFAAARGLPLLLVQHHHAHLAACMADNGVTERVIGLACDGTGYGTDGTSWGCELMVADLKGYTRLGHLANVPLPGGEQAIHEPWRMASVYLQRAFGPQLAGELEFCRRLDRGKWRVLAQMIERDLNCPQASSAGRLFDAASALLGLSWEAAYEGQAAMALEAVAVPVEEGYPSELVEAGGCVTLDPLPMICGMAEDLRAGRPQGEIAGRFHRGFAEMLREAAVWASEKTGLRQVALSGGTFQNRLLLETLCDLLEQAGLEPQYHKNVPPNDGGLSLGQAMVGGAGRLESLPPRKTA